MAGHDFLDRPGAAGAFGALMDEYARAAEDFCGTLEAVPPADFERAVKSPDPDLTSIRALSAHVVSAAHRYADYVRERRGLPFVDRYRCAPEELLGPGDVRQRLARVLHYTEGALDGLYQATDAEVTALSFAVRWGPTYDPEMILEHAIVHLLRHRRQITRWPRAGESP